MGNRLFVGNLSYHTTDDSLRAEFAKCGTVKDVHIVIDRESGRSRGFGFVEFATDGEASTAIQALDQHDLDGRTISVKEAEARKPGGGRPAGGGNRPSFGGGGGGGGYSGGGGGGSNGGGSGGGDRKSKGSRRRREDNDWG